MRRRQIVLGEFLAIREAQLYHRTAERSAARVGIVWILASRLGDLLPPPHVLVHLLDQGIQPFEVSLPGHIGELRNVCCNQPVGQREVDLLVFPPKQLLQLPLGFCAWWELSESACDQGSILRYGGTALRVCAAVSLPGQSESANAEDRRNESDACPRQSATTRSLSAAGCPFPRVGHTLVSSS
ncbi:hypothetical protein SBV1_2260010 [Verrucomicrobia bacterium]|nr:hypothetical protein SBV1_2260010 [Verrucomicrobiota bacterium]